MEMVKGIVGLLMLALGWALWGFAMWIMGAL